ncbi:MAG: alcohol dehydrogenase catalytic domain-containing protein [Oceanospirillaceae bacterium]|nr:alcohol dehydrogenase catalytic domain-containing protein [Oceanospirillaceae bacterium]
MLALRKIGPEPGVELVDVPAPKMPTAGEALISVAAAGICGSDLHVHEWTPSYEWMRNSLPLTLGHEFSGTILAVGEGDRSFKPGDRVVVRPSITCGVCPECQVGRPDDCTHRDSIGMLRDGAFAQQVLVPLKNCLPIPEGLPDEIAALAEPFTIAAQAINTADLQPGQKVAVFGPGTIGEAIAVLARARGSDVVVIGKGDAFRLTSLAEMGISQTLDLDDEDLFEGVARYGDGGKFDVVFEAAGSSHAVNSGLAILKNNGCIVVAGILSAPVEMDLTAVVRKQQKIKGSFRPAEKVWPEMIDFLAEHHEMLKPMVSHVVSIEEGLKGFDLAFDKSATKVMIKP